MKIATWYNISQKCHEAMVVGRGRPIRQDASAEDRAKSRREIFTGATKDEVLTAIAKAKGMTLDEVVESLTKESSVVYKGKRQHPSGWTRTKTEAIA